MGADLHHLSLLAGPRAALRVVQDRAPGAPLYATVRGASVLVMQLDDGVREGLHRANGTGEWLELGAGDFAPLLTTTDAAFFMRASAGSALAWFETRQDPFGLWQAAAVWIDGAVAMRPNVLRAGENRPRSLRPVNAALRLVGVAAQGGDEFAALGLDAFAVNDDIAARAVLGRT